MPHSFSLTGILAADVRPTAAYAPPAAIAASSTTTRYRPPFKAGILPARIGAVRVEKITDGLWYWTSLHPAWTPADGGPDGWEQEVGCVYYEAPGAAVLFDPLVPPEDADRFYAALDRDVARLGRPVRILLTVESHRRSSVELAERYGAVVESLRPLLELPVARALVGHGEPVLAGAHEALAAALQA
jgi:hypothetical protein